MSLGKLFLFSLISTLPLLAHGQRVIENGGGLAEMQALYFHQNLQTYLLPCLRGSLCRLSANDQQALQNVVDHQAREVQDIKVTFTSETEVFPFKTDRRFGSDIAIQSASLYKADSSPRSASEIAAIVLAARWAHADAKISLDQVLAKATQIFANMTITQQTVQASEVPSWLALHDYAFDFSGTLNKALFAEDVQKSYDLSDLTSAQLSCGKIADWRFQNWRHWASNQQLIFMSDATATCSGTDRYVLTITLELATGYLIDPARTRVTLQPTF